MKIKKKKPLSPGDLTGREMFLKSGPNGPEWVVTTTKDQAQALGLNHIQNSMKIKKKSPSLPMPPFVLGFNMQTGAVSFNNPTPRKWFNVNNPNWSEMLLNIMTLDNEPLTQKFIKKLTKVTLPAIEAYIEKNIRGYSGSVNQALMSVKVADNIEEVLSGETIERKKLEEEKAALSHELKKVKEEYAAFKKNTLNAQQTYEETIRAL